MRTPAPTSLTGLSDPNAQPMDPRRAYNAMERASDTPPIRPTLANTPGTATRTGSLLSGGSQAAYKLQRIYGKPEKMLKDNKSCRRAALIAQSFSIVVQHE